MSHKAWHQPKPCDTPQASLLSCTRKVRHTDVAAANSERDRLARTYPAPGFHFETYSCAFCGGYHVGKAPDMEQSA